ncbi:MAG TPA: hypothetical protein VEK79_22240 [Thermoanaerobaculia bacterium]|nr:hypothetical protein [Thermoanaerobaculia bacterium]
MFELLVLAAIAFIGFMVIAGAIVIVKLALQVALLPLKILFFPLVAIMAIVKLVVILAAGAIVFGIVIAIVVPLVVAAVVIGVPVLIVGALT